jgi:hypothetical protein
LSTACRSRWFNKELIVYVFDGVSDFILATFDSVILLDLTNLPVAMGSDTLGVQVDVTACDDEVVNTFFDISAIDVDGSGIGIIQVPPEGSVRIYDVAAYSVVHDSL